VGKLLVMTHHTATKRRGIRLFNYIGEIIGELKKVVWLTRREAAYLTVLVLIVSISAGIVLGALDYGFTGLVEKFFLGK
jgi:preprotein translocase subunit SecE